MNILVTGADGFIGKNLCVRLEELGQYNVVRFVRSDGLEILRSQLENVDVVFHLAGENRPSDESGFNEGNAELTQTLCNLIAARENPVKVVFSSSIQADRDNPYGISKRSAEESLRELSNAEKHKVIIFRLPNVFGKWCKPNYNSVVATFCHNIANDKTIDIHDKHAMLNLVYIDDVVSAFISSIGTQKPFYFADVEPCYSTSLEDLANTLYGFRSVYDSLQVGNVGVGLTRALYATYISYLPENKFSYELPVHGDERGVFVEMLKTPESGQFSYFTAGVGVTRGGHYHHTKTEKFLVLSGEASFKFRNILTNERVEIFTSGSVPRVVETIPGWAHDITNIGSEKMIVMLWANEVFNRELPDTVASGV